MTRSRFLIALLSLMTALSACGQKTLEGFQDSAHIMSVEDAKSQALEWMDDAQNSNSLNDTERAFALKVKTSLMESRILPSPDMHNMECSRGNGGFVAAYVSNEENSPIFVCEAGLDFGSEFLAQVFVHEAIHLSGIEDECQTTALEQKLISAGGGNPFKNSYSDACGLSL